MYETSTGERAHFTQKMSGPIEGQESESLMKGAGAVSYTGDDGGLSPDAPSHEAKKEPHYIGTDASILSQFHEDAISQVLINHMGGKEAWYVVEI